MIQTYSGEEFNHTHVVIILVTLAIIILLIAVSLCIYLGSSKGNRQPNSSIMNDHMNHSQPVDVKIPTYTVEKDNNNLESGRLSDLKEAASYDSSRDAADYSSVILKSYSADVAKRREPPATEIPIPREDMEEEAQYAVVDDDKCKETKTPVMFRHDYDTVNESEIHSRTEIEYS